MDLAEVTVIQRAAPPEPSRPETDLHSPYWCTALLGLAAVTVLMVNLEHQVALCSFTLNTACSDERVADILDETLERGLVECNVTLTIPDDDSFWAVKSPGLHSAL